MELLIPKAKLVSLAESAAACADPKSPSLQLRMARLELRGAELFVAGTDLKRTVEMRSTCDARQMGAALVDARKLLDLAKSLPASAVRIAVDSEVQTLTLSAERRKFSLDTLPVEDYPEIDAWPDRAKSWSMSSDAVQRLVRRARHAASLDAGRPHLNCVGLEEHTFTRHGKPTGEVGVRASSTDGHRLAVVHTTDRWGGPKVLVPEAATSLLLALADGGESVEFACPSPSALHARCGDKSIRIAVYDAQQPPIEQVIPARSDHDLVVSRSALRDAISAIGRAAGAIGSITLTFKAGTIRVKAESTDGAGGNDEVPCEGGPNIPVELWFNAKYPLDTLDAIESDDVRLEFSGTLDPVVFRDTALVDDVFVVMPRRV